MARILIVDDEEYNLFFLRESLENMGHEVADIAKTGEEAVSRALLLKPQIILMDIRMPGGMDGIQAAEEIRKQMDIPIIYLTAFGEHSYLEKVRNTEVYGYLIKPVNIRELQFSISIALYRKEIENRLKTSLEETEKEISRKEIIRGFLTRMNRLLDPLPILSEILQGLFDFQHCETLAVFEKKAGENGKTGYEVTHHLGLPLTPKMLARIAAVQTLAVDANTLEPQPFGGETGDELDGIIYPVFSETGNIGGLFMAWKSQFGEPGGLEKDYLTILVQLVCLIMIRHRDYQKIGLQEAEMVRQRDMLSRVERLSSLGRLTSAIGHEIYQPLQSIKVLAESVLYWEKQQQQMGYDEVKDIMHKISERVNRIDNIIKSMRSIVNSPEHAELKDTPIFASIRQAMDFFREDFQKAGVELIDELGDGDVVLALEETAFHQVLANLFQNAIHILEVTEKPVRWVKVSSRFTNGSMTLLISDNGKGIPDNIRDKIFDPFFTTGKSKGGMGMGLFLVFNLLKSFDASICAENNPDGGATFVITFPISVQL